MTNNDVMSPWENVAAEVFSDCLKDGIQLNPDEASTAFCRRSWFLKKALETNTPNPA